MAYRFTQRRIVAFSDTDLAGIVHFSNFYRYMEDCEHAFYRSLGYSVEAMDDGEGGVIGWPRVKTGCTFRKPLRFEEEFEIELLVEAVGGKSLTYLLRFWKGGDGEPVLAAEGRMVVACVRFEDGGMRSVDIPQSIRERIVAAPAELLAAPADSR